MHKKFDRLTIIAHLPHNKVGSEYVSYEPYVREIEVWAKYFDQINIYTNITKYEQKWPTKNLPKNCAIKKIHLKSGEGKTNKLIRLVQLPFVCFHIFLILLKSKNLHLRSPGLTTLVANQINYLFFNKKIIVKWATTFEKLPIKMRLLEWERQILLKPKSNTKVLIYGKELNENHISFIPALMTSNEINRLNENKYENEWGAPFQFIMVGRLYKYKNFDFVFKCLSNFKNKYPLIKWALTVVGDGELLQELKQLAESQNISKNLVFTGALQYRQTLEMFQYSHIAIMPGKYEGWPKIINEAWSSGCIPFVINSGNATYPLNFCTSGGYIFNDNIDSFTDNLHNLLNKPKCEIKTVINDGYDANKKMTLEIFDEMLYKVLKENYD
jgi:glycosyltransferase involved in cell wall biosynthesis